MCACVWQDLMLAEGQQLVGWSVGAGSNLIVWNNWAAVEWRANHTLGLIKAFLLPRPPLCIVDVSVWRSQCVVVFFFFWSVDKVSTRAHKLNICNVDRVEYMLLSAGKIHQVARAGLLYIQLLFCCCLIIIKSKLLNRLFIGHRFCNKLI